VAWERRGGDGAPLVTPPGPPRRTAAGPPGTPASS
jgi:hypothetical protein